MKRRIFALSLALAMLAALTACGGDQPNADGDPSGSPSASQTESQQPGGTGPAADEDPSESQPDESQEPDASLEPEEPDESQSPSPSPSESVPALNPDASASPSQSASAQPSQTPSQQPSQSPSQAPSQSPSQAPSQSPSQAPSQSPSQAPSQSPSQAASVDLQAFFEDLLSKYEEDYFSPNMAIDGNALDMWYPGLSDIALKQQVIYQPMISAVVCEIALVEVANAADIQAVKDIFQARIDYQVGTDDAPGGAWYPVSIEGWKNSSRIVSNGNYIMMIAWENCDQFVADFNALF